MQTLSAHHETLYKIYEKWKNEATEILEKDESLGSFQWIYYLSAFAVCTLAVACVNLIIFEWKESDRWLGR